MILVASAAAMPPLALLLQAGITAADTVVTVSATSTGLQFWVGLLTSIASIIIALALIVLAAALVPAALNSRKVYGRINETLKRIQADIAPLVKHAHSAAESVDYIASSARRDVELLNQAVEHANRRLAATAREAEERIQDFNALLKVMQEEAEDLFIGTAATIRGVKVGTESLARSRAEPEWNEPAPATRGAAEPPPAHRPPDR